MNILFIGDIVAQAGLDIACNLVPGLIRDLAVDYCIINGENADMGKGIRRKDAEKLLANGADVITGGNHSFQKNSTDVLKNQLLKTLRPANYPPDNPGIGYMILNKENKNPLAVLNLQGRAFLPSIDCPFRFMDTILPELKEQTKFIFVDFHGEATAEKQAFAWDFDGKVSAVVGTHTHVQTADNRILPKGTAYISDVGMTGAANSVIGMDIDTAIKRFRTQQLKYFKTTHLNPRINGVLVKINDQTAKASSIERINLNRDEYASGKNS